MTLLKKENLTISIGEYQNNNGDTKQEWKTIGELITMQGSDGPYQFFKLWGAGGAVEGKVFEQQERTNNNQQSQQQAPQQQQQQQGGYQQQNNQQQPYNNNGR